MEYSETRVVRMSFHRLDTALAEVVPDFDRSVVACRDEVWLIRARVEVDIVDALVVRIHGKVGCGRGKGPHLDGPVKARRCKGIRVFRVKGDIHDIMRMALIDLAPYEHKRRVNHIRIMLAHLNAFPLFVPIPSLDSHVVTTCEHDTRCGVYCEASYIVRVGLERDDLLVCVVIEDAQLEVVRAGYKPVFSWDELDATNGDG